MDQKRKLVTFRNQGLCEHCFQGLPSDVQSRVKAHKKVSCLIMGEEDYERVKSHFRRSELRSVENDVRVKLHRQRIPWGIRRIQAPSVWRATSGRRVGIAVFDTGIQRRHPDLRARVKGGTSLVDRAPFTDSNGHGTHVAGIAGASYNRIGVVGAAPRVSLYSVKAFASDGTGSISDIVTGVEWCLQHRIQVLNMSFGSQQRSEALHQAVRQAFLNGMTVVASAGNDGGAIDYPGAFPEALAVGAVSKQGEIPTFSSRGDGLDVVAPGVDIPSTWPTGNGYRSLSGTSMAAAHVSGITALVLQRFPSYTPAQIRTLLNNSAERVPNQRASTQGAGFVTMNRVKQQVLSPNAKVGT